MRQELKQVCLDFADKYPELGKLSFMKRRGKERVFYNDTSDDRRY